VTETTETTTPAEAPAAEPVNHLKHGYYWGLGRRKAAVARVRMRPNGSGQWHFNDKRNLEEYFQREQDRLHLLAPLHLTGTATKFDFFVNVNGGGMNGQAGAVRLGLSRALAKIDHAFYPLLKEHGYLSRDSRVVERKKPGKAGARASFQFSKR